MNIQNSVVVITSAGSHLGQNLAQHFLSLNANVILVDNNEASLNQALHHCQPYSSNVFQYLLDDESFESVQPLFSSINQQFDKGIDVLINLYPSLPSPSLIKDEQIDRYSRQYSKLATTMLCFSKLAARQMLHNQKRGVIVNLSSQEQDSISQPSSLISEFTQNWAKELMPFNIRVGGILPSRAERHTKHRGWAKSHDELIRNTEYIVENEYFNGRILDSY
ncbi:SDR family oxidoreductase [Vibrio litoralis]|uniref:SDR family oxidoreductase n=1 Tax=Vibrio litoralis TaxID=335972 RepID=UPI0004005400|nr:SDR family oxidoreductase [Vibrio litoralis]